jgi:imidazolonepropionase-like amidohydrolase
MSKKTVIFAEALFDGIKKDENCSIVLEGDKIIDITKKKMHYDYSGTVTPAFIDAHSHIGMHRSGEPDSEGETNDQIGQITPLHDPLNSIYFDDSAFGEAVSFGVLYSCVVPGSGNLLGGRARVIRNFADNRADALVHDFGFKMAMGFNPRSTEKWKGDRPNTRMGIYSMLEKKFDGVLQKKGKTDLNRERKMLELEKNFRGKKITEAERNRDRELIEAEYRLEFDAEETAILELLTQKKKAKVHVHKEDDVLYLIGLVKKYGLAVTADHLGDVFHTEIFNALADAGIPVVYGPLGSFAYKVELKHDRYDNTKLLMASKAFYGLMTDHPVIMTPFLRDSLKYFLIFGMKEEDAISLITYKNAKILGIDGMLGTVEAGKLASLVVWDQNPLHLAAFPKQIFAEGKIVRGEQK